MADPDLFGDIPVTGQQQQPDASPYRGYQGGETITPPKLPTPTTESQSYHLATGQEVADAIAKGTKLDPNLPYKVNAAGDWQPVTTKPAKAEPEDQATSLSATKDIIGNAIQAALRSKWRSQNDLTATGFMSGAGESWLPYKESLQKDLDTLGTNEAFNAIDRLKKQSDSGALNMRITQQEVQMFQQQAAALGKGQADPDFQRNMDNLIQRYRPMFEKLGGNYGDLEKNMWVGLNPPPGAADAAVQAEGASAAGKPNVPPPTGPTGPTTPSGPQPPALTPSGQVILQPGGDAIAGQDTGLVGEKGGMHSEKDPALAGMDATVNEMLKARRPASEIMSYIAGKETDPATGQWRDPGSAADLEAKVNNIIAWQHSKGQKYKGGYHVDLERRQVANTLNQNFQGSDVGQGIAAGVDAATGFNLDSAAGLVGRDPEEFRQAQAAAAAAHPASTLAGTIAGGAGAATAGGVGLEAAGLGDAAAAAAGGLGETGEALAPILARAVPTTAADIGYGTGAGWGATDYGPGGQPATIGERATGAAEGALGAGIGSVIGQGIAGPISAAARPAADESVRALNEAKVPTTVGQQYGKSGPIGAMVKTAEDKSTSLPLFGDMIAARRAEGVKKYNETEFNKALAPIKEKSGGVIGNEGVAQAQQKISAAYEKALGGKSVNVVDDPKFASDLEEAVNNLHGVVGVGPAVAQQVGEILGPYMQRGTNEITGHDMQEISQKLRDLKQGYYANGHPQKGIIGSRINAIEKAFFGPFERQTPEVVPAYNAAKVAQRRLFTIANAVTSAGNKEGIFMPSQLGRADTAASRKALGPIKTASGESDFFQSQRDAQRVLPGSYPDSGSAGRIGNAAAIVEAASHPVAAAKAAILATIYSRIGQRVLTKPGRGATTPLGKAGVKVGATVIPHVVAAEGRRQANQ